MICWWLLSQGFAFNSKTWFLCVWKYRFILKLDARTLLLFHINLLLAFSCTYLPNPSAQAGCHTKFFKQSLIGLNSEVSFSSIGCLTEAREHSLPYYLPIAGRRIIGFITFPRVLVLCEIQSALSRIWTHVGVSISYDDNHYATGTSILVFSCMVYSPNAA